MVLMMGVRLCRHARVKTRREIEEIKCCGEAGVAATGNEDLDGLDGVLKRAHSEKVHGHDRRKEKR